MAPHFPEAHCAHPLQPAVLAQQLCFLEEPQAPAEFSLLDFALERRSAEIIEMKQETGTAPRKPGLQKRRSGQVSAPEECASPCSLSTWFPGPDPISQGRCNIPGCEEGLIRGEQQKLNTRPGSKVSPTLRTATRVWRTRASSQCTSCSAFPEWNPSLFAEGQVTKARVPSKGLVSPELNVGSSLLSCLDPPEVRGHSASSFGVWL